MKEKFFLVKELWLGKSITRAYLNCRLRREELSGQVIDIGGGKSPDYLSFMSRKQNVSVITIDPKAGEKIDFEKDSFPLNSNSFDTILFLNVLEHIYNHQQLISEVFRILRPNGRIIGFVPFLMWYHPDPSDFFRYTPESLENIFKKAGVQKFSIEPIAIGPFTAAAQMCIQTFPNFLRVPIFLFFRTFDAFYLLLRPKNGERFALGYYFILYK